METVETIDIAASPADVFAHVESLDAYPAWLPLVHSAVPVDGAEGDPGPAWSVELRAKVGPFARSKQLRMVRSEHAPDARVVFVRREIDGREHAAWMLEAELAPTASAPGGAGARLTMRLRYDGALWTGGLLERVLDEQVREGRAGLTALVAGPRA